VLVGYERVSIRDQNPALQFDALGVQPSMLYRHVPGGPSSLTDMAS